MTISNVSPLISAIKITPVSLAMGKLIENGQQNSTAIGTVQSADHNNINLFALNSYVGLLESQQTLLDPTNDANGNTTAITNDIQNVIGAYGAANGLIAGLISNQTGVTTTPYVNNTYAIVPITNTNVDVSV